MQCGFSPFEIVVFIISILIGMTIHEAMHAYVGYKLGDDTALEQGRISLNPLHHIDPFATVVLPVATFLLLCAPILAAKPVPFNPYRVKYGEYGAALIAAAGPLSNLGLAIISALLLHVDTGGFLGEALLTFTTINIALFVFNLVPIPPLDGSRVLYAIAPEGLQEVMRRLEPYGFFIIILLVLVTGFGGIIISLNQFILHLLLGV